jgi:hypothetical protein
VRSTLVLGFAAFFLAPTQLNESVAERSRGKLIQALTNGRKLGFFSPQNQAIAMSG